MIQLFEQDVRKNSRQSSKGNQLKWEKDGIWYKADYTGYEGLSEYVISHLLQKSNLEVDEYALYELEPVGYKDRIYKASRSKNFLKDKWQIITLERLFQNFFGESLYKSIFNIACHRERLLFLVNQVERVTGLKNFGQYMNKLFTIDALFLNEDRHMHNIAVLMNDKSQFAYCPIFDNGAGLLSDTTMDYPMDGEIYQLVDSVKAKTICDSFDEQLDISEELYGCHLKFYFNKNDVKTLLNSAKVYSEEERKRVETVIYERMKKYPYLFVSN